jgi:hypothetical protein
LEPRVEWPFGTISDILRGTSRRAGRAIPIADIALNSFQRWLADVMRAAGGNVPAQIDPLGLSFEAEGRVARIFPHADDDLAVIEVVASSLDGIAESDLARLAVQLLRLNHEARFEHGWSIVLDDANNLTVTTTVSLSATRENMLAEILYDGIDRATALSTIVAGLISAETSDPESEPEPRPVPAGSMIRG